ncbi:methyltransferase domain-containing protein [Kordiimonas aquimaris]|uniref:methyltransferase domain-containing protein n=1 Tax=Kordiimonas aquimaris TaxID=707591 RepID=UPI0021D25549|nr:methyltransferase domain-containing protein [Kordiimonas aquimaris]
MIQQDTPPRLFDTQAVARNRARSQRMDDGHNFLKAEIADRMQERLSEVNRTFTDRVDLGGMFAPFVPEAVAKTYQIHRQNNDALDIPQQSSDLIVSNMIMHWVNDLPGLLVQIKNALRPDGLFTASMLGGQTLHELRHAFLAAESEITGGASARVIPFADVKDLGSLMQRAGFALPVTDVDTLTLTYTHPLNLMQELRGMGEANALVNRPKGFLRRKILMRACEMYQEKFGLENGRITATFEVMYLTGWHPHESQQKPLKPGSGKINLADALKAGGPPKEPPTE